MWRLCKPQDASALTLFSAAQYGDLVDFLAPQHVPVNAFGSRKLRLDFDDFGRRHDRAERNIVRGHRDLFVDNLQRMNRSHNRSSSADLFFLGQQGEFQIRVAAAFADARALPIDRDGAANDQIDFVISSSLTGLPYWPAPLMEEAA